MAERSANVVVVRGHLATPWELRQWVDLPARFQVSYLSSQANHYDVGDTGLRPVPVRTLRARMPKGRIGDVAAGVAGDRYLGLERALGRADIVHAEELSFWFSASAARARGDFKLVQTVWETIPFLDAFRNRHARRYRAEVLARTDLFLPATQRARHALLLEGVPEERIEVCAPGIDLERFRRTSAAAATPAEHTIVSPGRLVWEKGHQDVLRAVAALHRGLDGLPVMRPRVLLVGSGPEQQRLTEHARELGIGEAVAFRSVPYDEMPAVFASASCMVLMSLATAQAMLHPFDTPRAFWEEQFGLVLAEAMAAGLSIISSTSGAIPEVVGEAGRYVASGDWLGLARELAAGPLLRPPGQRVEHDPARLQHFSTTAAAARLAAAYDRLL
ncbi:MAG: glycosyltransferase family 4 protein [Solirubrobacteraceae bacterium]